MPWPSLKLAGRQVFYQENRIDIYLSRHNSIYFESLSTVNCLSRVAFDQTLKKAYEQKYKSK